MVIAQILSESGAKIAFGNCHTDSIRKTLT
jgi:hypothetical protein